MKIYDQSPEVQKLFMSYFTANTSLPDTMPTYYHSIQRHKIADSVLTFASSIGTKVFVLHFDRGIPVRPKDNVVFIHYNCPELDNTEPVRNCILIICDGTKYRQDVWEHNKIAWLRSKIRANMTIVIN